MMLGCADGASLEEAAPKERLASRAAALTFPGRDMPPDIGSAAGQRWDRMDNVARAFARRYVEDRDKPDFAANFGFDPYSGSSQAKMALAKISAGLYVLKWSFYFPDLAQLTEDPTRFVRDVRSYLTQRLRTLDGVGTDRDYDMVLKDMLTLFITFSDDYSIQVDGEPALNNDAIWAMVCQTGGYGGCEDENNGAASWSGQTFNLRPSNPWVGSTAETENHVLMIGAWHYFINDYVRWVGEILHNQDPSHPRYDMRIAQLYARDPSRYNNDASYDTDPSRPSLVNLLLEALARPLHNGIFEQNSKAYESFSLHSILNIHLTANKLFYSATGQKVQAAAKNALDAFAAKFALQTLEGKRYAPMRRDYGKRRRAGIGNNDYVMDIMGMLSGAYKFYDNAYNGDTFSRADGRAYYYSRYYWGSIQQDYEIDQAAAHALWTALFMDKGTYSLPNATHDFMLDKHSGYFLRQRTLFTRENSTYVGHYGTAQDPQYFVDYPPYSAWTNGSLNTSPEFYFVTPSYMNVAGGHWQQYFDRALFGLIDSANTYNWISFPYAVIPSGDVGRSWGKEGEDLALMQEDVPIMIGNHGYPHESRNIWTYKNFSYGYTWFEGGNVDRHTRWPQLYPAAWNEGSRTFQIGRANFRILDLRSSAGYYLILGQVSKSNTNDTQLYQYGRGFWEVVPGNSSDFPNLDSVENRVRAYNPTQNFPNYSNSNSGTKHYWYKLAVSGDTLKLDQKAGSSVSCQAFMEIRDHNGTVLDLAREHTNFCSESTLRAMPLMEAREVDAAYRFTGRKYAYAAGDGLMRVCNPYLGEMLVLDSRDYRSPTQWTEASGDCRL
jgi:hypothetical protein